MASRHCCYTHITSKLSLDFLTKQPVEGPLLADRLAEGALPAEEAVQYAIEVGSQIHQAHARGLVHGNLCPAFICLTACGAQVLAPPAHAAPAAAAYRSPEQVRGEPPDARSDIFAYGALVYEMAAGTPAFLGEGRELARSILQDPAPTLTLRSPIYDAMARVVAGCLEKSPSARRQRIQNAVLELRFGRRRMEFFPAGSPPRRPFSGRPRRLRRAHPPPARRRMAPRSWLKPPAGLRRASRAQ